MAHGDRAALAMHHDADRGALIGIHRFEPELKPEDLMPYPLPFWAGNQKVSGCDSVER